MSESVKIVNNKSVGTTNESVGKRHADFSSVETMAKWAGNQDWIDGYRSISDDNVEENDYTTLWKALKSSSESTFNELYGSIANLADNIANLDLCTVNALRDKANEFGMDDGGVIKLKVNFPVEISKMVDLFSVNKAHLRGVLDQENGSQERKYALTTIASEQLWQQMADECTDDATYRKFIRNTFYNTLKTFVNLTTADGSLVIWKDSPKRYSTDLFFSRVEYATPVETFHGTSAQVSYNDGDKKVFERKQKLGIPRYFSEKYYTDEILIGNRTLDQFTDAEQEIIRMEIERREALWENSGINHYTYVREIKVLNYIRFVTLFANAIYDLTDYDLDKRKSELLGLDESKYLIRQDGGVYSVDESMIGSVADTLTDYCINISYFRETVRVQAQKNMLKGTKALIVDSIREVLAKNVYSAYGSTDNFWRQSNTNGVVGIGVEMPNDLDIDVVEYIDTTRYTNIRAKEEDDLDVVNVRFWQISGVQGDLDPDDVLDFYNRLTEYKDPWHIFECANTTEAQLDPKVNLWQHLNYVYNSGAFSATLTDLIFDTETVAGRIAPKMTEIYGYDEIVALLRGASTSAEVPGRLPKIYFDYSTAATTLVDAFDDIDCGTPQYKPDGSGELTDDYAALYKRYHDYDTIKDLISSFKTPDEFIANAQSLFPSAYFDTIKTYDYLYSKIVYEDNELSSSQVVTVIDADGNISSTSSYQYTSVTNADQTTTTISGGITTIVTVSGSSVSVLPEKPYTSLTGYDNSFDKAWNVLLSNPEYQNPDRLPEVFYYVSEYPSLYDEVFGDNGNYRHDTVINTIQTIGDDFNYDATDIVAASSTYVGTMIHETGIFGDALYNHIGDIEYGIRPFAHSQNTVHPSVQVHAFLSALIEYVNSYHAIVQYLDVSQPKFSTYCQTIVDRIDKLGNTIHYWKNSVDDFSGYTTDYEKGGNDSDVNASIDGPFNFDALQELMDDKVAFIDGIKQKTNEYYISKSSGTFMLNDSEIQTEIDNIVIYYDDICRLATKEIARFGRDKYGNTYVLYKDNGSRMDRSALGRLWIRKSNRPLAFPGIVVDEMNGTLSNNSQVTMTDNATIESKIVEQYKYPQEQYDDINLVGCYLSFPVESDGGEIETKTARCYKVNWATLASKTSAEFVSSCRASDGYHPVSGGSVAIPYFTSDADGSIIASGQGSKIWNSGLEEPRYLKSTDTEYNYSSDVAVGDYKEGDLEFNMLDYETHNYQVDTKFQYSIDSGHYADTEDSEGVREITFVVCQDEANIPGHANNYFLDTDSGKESITYHQLRIYGIYTVRLPENSNVLTNPLVRLVSMTMYDAEAKDNISRTIDVLFNSVGDGTQLVGTLILAGDDTNAINIDCGDVDEKTGGTTALANIDGNGQNIGKYYDFALNETLDVIVLDCKDPHYNTYEKSWAVDAMINQPDNVDGTKEIQFFKDTQHNIEYISAKDRTETSGLVRKISVHCGNVYSDDFVHVILATIQEVAKTASNGDVVTDSNGNTVFVPTSNVSFQCCSFGYDTYYEGNFAPTTKYAPVKIDGNYHFRVNASGESVYVAFCSSLPDDDDRVGNYVNGYDGLVAGSTSFKRCADLVKENGVTVVGFESTKKGLTYKDDIRYVVPNETLGYYPQYSGLVGRNMTYANQSMVGRDLFGFELMFDRLNKDAPKSISGEIYLEYDESVFNDKNLVIDKQSSAQYDGTLFLQYDEFETIGSPSGVAGNAFLTDANAFQEIDLGDNTFYSIGFDFTLNGDVVQKTGQYILAFDTKLVAREASVQSGTADYEANRPSILRRDGDDTVETKLDVVLEDLDYDDDGNVTEYEISETIREVSNLDQNCNFIIIGNDNFVAACHLDEEAGKVYVKSIKWFEMDDTLTYVDNTFDGKFIVYPKHLTSDAINFVHATTNSNGYLDIGYYVTEYADSADVRDVEIFNDSVFIIFDDEHIDHVFKVDNCFVDSGVVTEEFIILNDSGSNYSTFTSDNDHLFLMPSTLDGTILIFNPQTDDFDEAYQLKRLVRKAGLDSQIIATRIVDDKLRMLVHYQEIEETTDIFESRRYLEVVANIGSDVDYAILELDKGFPILVTYEEVTVGSEAYPGATEGDNILLHFQCMFNTNDTGRNRTYTAQSWSRDTISFAYSKATESGKEFDALERYGSDDNQYVYGDARLYKITATGGRKFYIERLYRSGDYPTGEFDSAEYLSFTYNLAGYPNARRNKMFAHLNSQTFRYTVSGPFTDLGYELGTQYDVGPTATEIAEKFRGLSISRNFDTYWLSGEIYHLSSVVEPTSYEYREKDCLIDSNLAFAKNTIICSCESMFDGHVNLLCTDRYLNINYDDNSQHIRNTRNMFRGDIRLVLPDVSITNCNILDTRSMFEDCNTAILAGASFPDHLTSVERMFCNCTTARFDWTMVMPGTVISSLSSVFYNCNVGTFTGFYFDAFPRYRSVEDEKDLGEIITMDDPLLSLSGNTNERNFNDSRIEISWEDYKIADNNSESGRFVVDREIESHEETVTDSHSETITVPILAENLEAGRFMSDSDQQSDIFTERYLSLDMDGETSAPLLNFGGDIIEQYEEKTIIVTSTRTVVVTSLVTEGDDPTKIDEERFLSFDMNYVGPRPLLNFDDEVWGKRRIDTPITEDEDYLHSGRFANVVENDLIGDYMFWNTPKFNTNDIAFYNVAHTLCSTISMFEKCATLPSDIDDEIDPQTGKYRKPNSESGRFMSDTDAQTDFLVERFFSFDMDSVTDAPLLNFERDYEYSNNGLQTFDGVTELPNLVDGRRMFKSSAFRFYESTIRVGRRIDVVNEMFRNCGCIVGTGPRIQTYDFRGTFELDSTGKLVGIDIPEDARAMYAQCIRMTDVDVELLGSVFVVDPFSIQEDEDTGKFNVYIIHGGEPKLSQTYDTKDDAEAYVSTQKSEMVSKIRIYHDYMFCGCTKLEAVTGQINPYLTSARGMFMNCTSLGKGIVDSFLRPIITVCDVTGMFYGCTKVSSEYTKDQIIEKLGGSDHATGDPFADPGELPEELSDVE